MATIIHTSDVGSTGGGLPEGGKAGQFLKKKTDSDFDCEWSDNNSIVEVEVNKSSLLTNDGFLIAYRIGYMIVIEAADVSIKTPLNIVSPNIEIGYINKIPEFNFESCITVYASYDGADGEYTGYGMVYGDVDWEAVDGRYVIYIPRARNTSYRNINFSMIIPLYDDSQTSGPSISA